MTRGKILKLLKETDRICRLHRGIERSHVYHTLLLLTKTPSERLNRALTRASHKFYK